jgi:transposase
MKIKEMYESGIAISDIARRTGHDRKTIRKMIHSAETPKYKRDDRPSLFDPYKSYIQERLAQGVLNATKIYDEIKMKGYQGKHSILRDYIHPFRPIAESRFTERFETSPGEQAQCDWGSFNYILDGKVQRKLYCFIMVLSYSRMMYIEFTTQMDEGTLLRCHINSFQYFGGVPAKILYDNQKTVVTNRDSEGHPIWNERFLSFAKHYNVTPKLCHPYRPRTKGKVERLVRYI